MLNIADTLLASPEKAIKRKRRTQAEMLQDARKNLQKQTKIIEQWPKSYLQRKKRIEKIEKKLQDGQ